MKEIIKCELKNSRVNARLTLAEAAKLSEINITTISAYENIKSKRKMNLDIILKLIKIYNDSPDIFFKKCIAKLQ